MTLGAFATSSPFVTAAARVEAGVRLRRALVAVTGQVSLPELKSVAFSTSRLGSIAGTAFSAALEAGYCWGARWLLCPSAGFGLRGLAVSPTGTLYQQQGSVLVVPAGQIGAMLHVRLAPGWALFGRAGLEVPLGQLSATVEGTSVAITTGFLEGSLGLGVAWSPAFEEE